MFAADVHRVFVLSGWWRRSLESSLGSCKGSGSDWPYIVSCKRTDSESNVVTLSQFVTETFPTVLLLSFMVSFIPFIFCHSFFMSTFFWVNVTDWLLYNTSTQQSLPSYRALQLGRIKRYKLNVPRGETPVPLLGLHIVLSRPVFI